MENFFCVSFNVPHTMQNSRYQCFAYANVSLIQFRFQPKLREISFLLHRPTVKSSKQYIPTKPQPSPHTTQTRQEDDVCCFLSFFLLLRSYTRENMSLSLSDLLNLPRQGGRVVRGSVLTS